MSFYNGPFAIFLENRIRNNSLHTLSARMQALQPASLGKRGQAWVRQQVTARRLIRYGLVTLNVGLLLAISWFTLGPDRSRPLGQQGVLSAGGELVQPLDQLSSADIAVSASIAVGLYETPGVINQADSVRTEQTIAPADTTVVAKPQIIATPLNSRRDIKDYVVQAGDTVSSIAAKFGITSDSVMWSNNLRGNAVNEGLKLVIPPISGIVYTVQQNDSVDSLAQKFRANRDQIIAYNDIELTGLKVGERILVPYGQQPAPVIPRFFALGAGYNGYDTGFCTWHVANRRAQVGRPVPPSLGDAYRWDDNALALGMSVNKSPAVGAAVVTSQRRPGHVAFVEAINADGSVWISEMNSRGQVSMTDTRPRGGWGVVDWKIIPAATAANLNYIH